MEFKIITEDRYEDVVQHLRESFFLDEPLNKAVDLCKQGEGHPDLENYIYEILKENISLMALSENGEIAGVLLNGILTPDCIETTEKELELFADDNFKKIIRFFNMITKKANIFERFNVDTVFALVILSVDKRFRHIGLAKELVSRSEKIGKDLNFRIVKSECSSFFSQKAMKSVGFLGLEEVYYDKWCDESGQPIFKVDPPHIKTLFVYKKLF